VKCGYDFKERKDSVKKENSEDLLDELSSIIRPAAKGVSEGPGIDADIFEAGTLFADRYEILSVGMKGGMGVVYKCRDKKLDAIKALKVIHPRLLSAEEALQRFRQEVSISQKLQHKNIVRVHDIDEYNGIEFFTMEWVDGRSLRGVITERKKQNKPFTLEEAYKIVSQLADALYDAHKLTIHRDIKPENILITEGEEGVQIKLTDFGIAKMLAPSQFLSSSGQMGTPYYMAPEQKVDASRVDKRADIYAMGVMLFELLTLENTIGFELPSEINKALPKEIDGIIKKALSTKPEDRYGDVKEFSGAINNLFAIKKKETGDKKSEEIGQRQRIEGQRKYPFMPKVFVGVAILVVLVLGVYFLGLKQEAPKSTGIETKISEKPEIIVESKKPTQEKPKYTDQPKASEEEIPKKAESIAVKVPPKEIAEVSSKVVDKAKSSEGALSHPSSNVKGVEAAGFILRPIKCMKKGDKLICIISFQNMGDEQARLHVNGTTDSTYEPNSHLYDNYGNQYRVTVQIGTGRDDWRVDQFFTPQVPININFITSSVHPEATHMTAVIGMKTFDERKYIPIPQKLVTIKNIPITK